MLVGAVVRSAPRPARPLALRRLTYEHLQPLGGAEVRPAPLLEPREVREVTEQVDLVTVRVRIRVRFRVRVRVRVRVRARARA